MCRGVFLKMRCTGGFLLAWPRSILCGVFLGRSSGGLPEMSGICCGMRRESQAACPAL